MSITTEADAWTYTETVAEDWPPAEVAEKILARRSR